MHRIILHTANMWWKTHNERKEKYNNGKRRKIKHKKNNINKTQKSKDTQIKIKI